MKPKSVEKYSPYFKKPEKNSLGENIKGVPDYLDYDLKVLFVGINPGIASGSKGHHYASPTNRFWPSLSESGLVDQKLTFENDAELPKRYRLGLTNLSARTTKRMSDLSLAEQREGIPLLNDKIKEYRPRVACFIGKGIYEIYSNKKCSELGLQTDITVPWLNGKGETVIFVIPSTSGLVSAYKKPDRVRFFQELTDTVETQDKVFPPL
ncbi:uracil-DNA glycosylase-like protein [Sporodiniella umbellata]|nr:uracil-DNA glycosylase-like protein [Sporodiniella umbellata]